MSNEIIGSVVVLVAGLMAECSTDWVHSAMRQEPARLTKFLPNNQRLVRQPDTFPVHYSWMDMNAVNKADFKYIYIAPVDLSYLRKGNGYDEWRDKVTGLDDSINELGEYARQVFISEVKKRNFPIANSPYTPNTAIVELAITAFVPTRAEIAAVGTAADFVIPGIGIVSDCLSSGEIAVECRIRDSVSKEIVLMFADTEGDPDALLSLSKFTYTSSAKYNLKRLAEQFVESCVIEDASKMRRDFPLSIINGPWNTKLD